LDWDRDGIGHQFTDWDWTENHGHQFESWRHFGGNGNLENHQLGRMRMRFSGAVDHQTFRDDLWKFPIRVPLKQFHFFPFFIPFHIFYKQK
jgi:hypothetical protein